MDQIALIAFLQVPSFYGVRQECDDEDTEELLP